MSVDLMFHFEWEIPFGSPEGGWEEPYELDKFIDMGFQQITLGPRVLRSDVAVISLLTLAHEMCALNR